MSREAMQIALDALEANLGNWAAKTKSVEVLRQALETEQEPVAWASSLDFDDEDQEIILAKDKGKLGTSNCDIALYTAPKQWVGLTDEEINSVRHNRDWTARWTDTTFARAIEAKLREKNKS
jgi:hypothetical protein